MKRFLITMLVLTAAWAAVADARSPAGAKLIKGIELSYFMEFNAADTQYFRELGVGIIWHEIRYGRGRLFGHADSLRNFNPDSLVPPGIDRYIKVLLPNDYDYTNVEPEWWDFVDSAITIFSGPNSDRPFVKYWQFSNEPDLVIPEDQRAPFIDFARQTSTLARQVAARENADIKLVFTGIAAKPDRDAYPDWIPLRATYIESLLTVADSVADIADFHCYVQLGSTQLGGMLDWFKARTSLPVMVSEMAGPRIEPETWALVQELMGGFVDTLYNYLEEVPGITYQELEDTTWALLKEAWPDTLDWHDFFLAPENWPYLDTLRAAEIPRLLDEAQARLPYAVCWMPVYYNNPNYWSIPIPEMLTPEDAVAKVQLKMAHGYGGIDWQDNIQQGNRSLASQAFADW